MPPSGAIAPPLSREAAGQLDPTGYGGVTICFVGSSKLENAGTLTIDSSANLDDVTTMALVLGEVGVSVGWLQRLHPRRPLMGVPTRRNSRARVRSWTLNSEATSASDNPSA